MALFLAFPVVFELAVPEASPMLFFFSASPSRRNIAPSIAKLAIRNRYPAFIRQLVVNPDVGLPSGEHGLDFSLGGLHLDPADVSAFYLFFPHIGSSFLDLEHPSANILFYSIL